MALKKLEDIYLTPTECQKVSHREMTDVRFRKSTAEGDRALGLERSSSGVKPNSHCRTGYITGRAQCKMECGSFVQKLLRISKRGWGGVGGARGVGP